MAAASTISVPFRSAPRRPLGEVFTSVAGTVNGLPVTITLTNDELHIQPHFEVPAAHVDLMDIVRALVGAMARSQFQNARNGQ